jgi:hypothetical protein
MDFWCGMSGMRKFCRQKYPANKIDQKPPTLSIKYCEKSINLTKKRENQEQTIFSLNYFTSFADTTATKSIKITNK